MAGDTSQPKSIDERLQKFIDTALYGGGSETAQSIRNFLNGVWLGEPLHVVLTDIPVGAWTVALIFDGLDCVQHGREFAAAADAAIAIGLAGAAGAALSGIADWSDVDPPARRVGVFHGLLNLSAVTFYTTSLIFRRKKMRTRGRLYAALGFSAMVAAARLGGKMVYEHRVGVDRTSGQVFPEQFVEVMAEPELKDETPVRVEHGGVPILLVRRGQRVFALADSCSHFGGPLSEGKLEGDNIVCPWHSSRFALSDGRVIDGPAVHPQPCLEARIRDGKIEVRKSACNGSEVAAPIGITPATDVAGQPG
ncbi:MAG: Rieske 2Fe-2S domain-containing protein [Acidobacteriaceae bacterium]